MKGAMADLVREHACETTRKVSLSCGQHGFEGDKPFTSSVDNQDDLSSQRRLSTTHQVRPTLCDSTRKVKMWSRVQIGGFVTDEI